MIKVYAFRWVPPMVQGNVRDLRVRWALEEAGLPYEQELIGREDQASPRYRRLQPFGQVPAYEEDGLVLFESGAIVHHIAQRSAALMPEDAAGRARVTQWMFAALNSIEPAVQQLGEIDLFQPQEAWAKVRRPQLVDRIHQRFGALADRLGGRDHLESAFTAADILMATVLRLIRHTDIVAQVPVLDAYQRRCEARPAFQKALADHLRCFADAPPPAS